MHILITGYYNKSNYGDDLFNEIAANLFNQANFKKRQILYKIIPIEEILAKPGKIKYDRLILFGGETLNNYFLDILIKYKALNPQLKMSAVGVSSNQ